MKQILRMILTFLLTLTTALSLGTTAFAADSTVTFCGRDTGFAFQPGSEYTVTDLFGDFKNVMPGDKLTETIQIKNQAVDCDYVKCYIRAQAHEESGNPLTYSETYENKDGKDQAGIEGIRDETVATMSDFLSQLSMKVYNGTEVIYEASPDELEGFTDNVYLATLRQGEAASLTVELTVPIELGNEYANRVGEVDWVFSVEALDDPEPEEPDTEEPEEPSAPLQQPPRTGDTSNIALFIALAGVTGVALILLLVLKRHKDMEEN